MHGRSLGFGDFVNDGPNPIARSLYLHAVSACVPEALHALVALPEPRTDAERVGQGPLREWAETWGFLDPWALRYAQQHAEYWRADPSSFGRWGVAEAEWVPNFPAAPSAWNPISQTEAAYRARIDAYIAAVKQTPGITLAPTKRGPDHFKWLAWHHVGQWTYDQIAAEYPDYLESSSISQAIRETATIVGVTLRLRPGRKLGQRRRP